MVIVCRCKGSCGYIHASCLKEWIKHKFSVRTLPNKPSKFQITNCTFIKYYCEICKYDFPKFLFQNDRCYNFIGLPTPDPPYIVLCCQAFRDKYNLYILSLPRDYDRKDL